MSAGSRGAITDPPALADVPVPAAAETPERGNGVPPAAVTPETPRRALTRADIMAPDAGRLPMEDVPADEWAPGGFVTVRAMDGADRSIVEAATALYHECIRAAAEGKDLRDNPIASPLVALERVPPLHCIVAQRCIVDRASGERLLSHADIAALAAKHAGPVSRAYHVVMRLSRMTQADRDAIEKNSKATSGGSSS